MITSKHCLTALILLVSSHVQAQIGTSADTAIHPHRDSSYTIRENLPKSKFWGNSWHFSAAYNLNKQNEFDINIGRTYGVSSCSGGGCVYSMRSWGLGFGIANKSGQQTQLAKAFLEQCIFYFPPISVGARAEYMYDITNRSHYVRPAAGVSLFALDLFYNYSFNLSNTPNLFKHGLTIRIKYFHRTRNWQKNYPSRC